MATWSWIRLSLHAQCPRRYWHRYIDRTKALVMATSSDLYFGLRVHEAMRHMYDRQRDGIVPTEDEVVTRFRERWEALRPTGERALGFRAKELQEPETIALGERLIREFFRAKLPFDQDRTVDLEVNLAVVLDADGTRFGGRADRIAVRPDGTWVITDYKTTGRLPRRKDLEQDGQLALYALAVQAAWPAAKSIELRWEFLRFGGADTIVVTPEMLESVRGRVLGLIRGIEAQGRDQAAFPIRPSPLCRWCPYQHCCEGGRHAYEMRINGEPAPAMKSAADLVDEWVKVDQDRKAAAKALADIEERIDNLKLALTTIADAEKLAVICGTTAEARITRTDRLIPPRKTHEPEAAAALEAALRASSWWAMISGVDRFKLLSALTGESAVPPELLAVIRACAIRELGSHVRLMVSRASLRSR